MLVNELSNSHIIDVSLGKSHSVAVCSKGKVFAWGKSSEGFPGYEGDSKTINKPRGVFRVPVSASSRLAVRTGSH